MTKVIMSVLAVLFCAILGLVIVDFSKTDTHATPKRHEIENIIKERFTRADGMVESTSQGTTSESQSYLMLIAALSGDKELFDRTWQWTKTNIRVRGDNLFAWVWRNGSIQDMHSASDADEDIALALILASRRWDDMSYRDEALDILADFWEKDTKMVAGRRYVTGGDWGLEDSDGAVLNPSYFAPYEYRVFARFDREHNWMELVDSSYDALKRCSSPRGLPPNWCKINTDGAIARDFYVNSPDPDRFSYDAMRVLFRIALDHRWFGEHRAQSYLSGLTIFSRDWGTRAKIFAAYETDGTPNVDYESYANYGAQAARFLQTQPITAQRIIREKIIPVNTNMLDFYDLAWLWFGLYFYTDDFGKRLIE